MPDIMGILTPSVMAITTPLGADVLLFSRMSAVEELARLSEYQIDLLSKRSDIDLDEIMGKNVTVRLELPGVEDRFFNGYVTRFEQRATQGSYYAYHAVVRPWLWFLTRRANCRIFQDMTVPDIIKEIFADHDDIADVEFELTGHYSTWEYCVQYRESDFNFVSRLMEQEGVYYFFKHQDKRHTLVIADSYTAHEAVAGYEAIPFIPTGSSTRPRQEHITDWKLAREIQPGKLVMDDYNFKTPSVELQSQSQFPREHAQAGYEVYDYPGEYGVHGEGEHYVKTRLEELQAQFEIIQAQGNARGICVGSLFTLTGHTRLDQNREHLITRAEYTLKYSTYEAVEGAGADYHCSFKAMNSRQPFRAKSSTHKSIVQGPQTAVVVGPAGDEIYTDNYGRVKVQFHWDREGQHDENASCWIRVSNPWAGKTWGATALPRIGQEVIVDFLEGDPDRPIITGRVYNAEQMPAQFSRSGELPTNHALAGLHSRELKGTRYNELLFDDTAGEIRVKLSSEHAKSQLNLGYLTHPRDGAAEARGEGFELRTDHWGSVRAGKGLFLTADGRAQAVGGQLSREELVACLQEALTLAKSLTSQAKSQQAGSADTDPQAALAKAAADWGHGANAEKNGGNGGARIIAASAPDGIALATPKDLTSFSGQHTDLVAQKNHQFTSGQQTHIHAGTGLHQYANSGGISSIANQGKHLTQAQHDDVVINAEQSINLTASKQHILAVAEQHITLTAGGAYIKLQGGNIELGCPGSFIVKAGNYSLVGPANMKEELPKFVKGDVGRKVQLSDPASGMPVKGHAFSLTKANGSVVKGVTDASGHTPLEESPHYDVSRIDFVKKS